jgi:uncharacterized protein (TIGR02145 family)
MKIKILSLILLLSFVCTGCKKSSNSIQPNGDIKIDKQIWMPKNLDVTKFNNGDLIPEAKSNSEWVLAMKNGTPAWCYIENDSINAKKFGVLYNWFAINDKRGIAPLGFHIPSKEEWNDLITYSGGNDIAGDKLKSKKGWDEDLNGTDDYGFCGLPGGFRDELGDFNNKRSLGMFWTTTEYKDNNHWYFISLDWGTNDCDFEIGDKGYGFSVRCI